MERNKNIHAYLILIAALLAVLGVAYMKQSGVFISEDNVAYLIEEDYKKSKEFISHVATDEKTKIDAEQLLHQIYIYNQDSLVAWNTVYNHTSPSHRFKQIETGKMGRYSYRILTPSKKTVTQLLKYEDAGDQNSTKKDLLMLFTLISFFSLVILCYQYFYSFYRNDGTDILPMGNIITWFVSIMALYYFKNPYLTESISLYVGNLHIFQILLSAIYLYYHTRYINSSQGNYPISKWKITSIVFSIGLLLLGLCLMIKYFIYYGGIYSFDTIAIQYSSKGVLFLGVVIMSMLSIFYYSVESLSHIRAKQLRDKYIYGIIGVLITAVIAYKMDPFPWVSFSAFFIAYLLLIDLNIESKRKKIIFTFWWMLVFSGALSLITYYYVLKKDIADRKSYIEQVYFEKDNSLKKISLNIDRILRNSDVFQPIAELRIPATLEEPDYIDYIRHTLKEHGFKGVNRFDLDIHGYDQYGKSVFSNTESNYSEIRKTLSNSDRESNALFYSPYTGRYYLLYSIDNKHYRQPLYVYVSVFDRRKDKKIISDFNYVILKNGEVLKSEIANTDIVPLSKLYRIEKTMLEGEYSYVVSRPQKDVKIISYKKSSGVIKPISLFSFLLTFSGVIIFLLYLIHSYIPFLPSKITILLNRKASLRNKIQLTIVLLIVFSFIIIGLVTTYYFRNVLDKNRLVQDQRETVTILNNIKSAVEGAQKNSEAQFILENNIKEIADNQGADITIYDTQGRLMTSSDDVIDFERIPMDLLSTILNNKTAELRRNQRTHTLIPLFNNSSKPYATLSIAHTPELTKSNSIIDFLSTILNVYVFLFLTASALAIGISNSITKPLSILADKLREFKLGKRNEKLVWNSSDEIGVLINDYNNLTQELQDSADIIAKTQRDMAWREMAKQVAHEIKNPLTPMKLSIQYLQRKIVEDPENAPAMMQRISDTLVEQINNLNQIADEFSNFAKMPKAENERVALNEIVESIHDLFRKRQDIEINLSVPIDNVIVFADRNHLVRILNNIVKNAIQAIPTDRKGKIDISLYRENQNSIISVTDNGSGISDEMKSKVFEPNFTTKSSGTGLGLAISANMIDSFNGKIFFDTELGKGTTFFIEIPLMRLDDNIPTENRVVLD